MCPVYLLIRVPLITLCRRGACGAVRAALPFAPVAPPQRRDIALLSLTVIFPLACQVIVHGPAFTGLRHFLFVIPSLAALAGIGLDTALDLLAAHGRLLAAGRRRLRFGVLPVERRDPGPAASLRDICSTMPLVGGLQGASRRYDLDYWFNSMPEAIDKLEAYLRHSPPAEIELAEPDLFGRGMRRAAFVREDRQAAAAALGLHADLGAVGLFHRADADELR